MLSYYEHIPAIRINGQAVTTTHAVIQPPSGPGSPGPACHTIRAPQPRQFSPPPEFNATARPRHWLATTPSTYYIYKKSAKKSQEGTCSYIYIHAIHTCFSPTMNHVHATSLNGNPPVTPIVGIGHVFSRHATEYWKATPHRTPSTNWAIRIPAMMPICLNAGIRRHQLRHARHRLHCPPECQRQNTSTGQLNNNLGWTQRTIHRWPVFVCHRQYWSPPIPPATVRPSGHSHYVRRQDTTPFSHARQLDTKPTPAARHTAPATNAARSASCQKPPGAMPATAILIRPTPNSYRHSYRHHACRQYAVQWRHRWSLSIVANSPPLTPAARRRITPGYLVIRTPPSARLRRPSNCRHMPFA